MLVCCLTVFYSLLTPSFTVVWVCFAGAGPVPVRNQCGIKSNVLGHSGCGRAQDPPLQGISCAMRCVKANQHEIKISFGKKLVFVDNCVTLRCKR